MLERDLPRSFRLGIITHDFQTLDFQTFHADRASQLQEKSARQPLDRDFSADVIVPGIKCTAGQLLGADQPFQALQCGMWFV